MERENSDTTLVVYIHYIFICINCEWRRLNRSFLFVYLFIFIQIETTG